MTKTKYFFFRNDQRQEYFEFNPQDPDCLRASGYQYFGLVCHHLWPLLKFRGLEIIVTPWTVHELPKYGKNVIAIIVQDEWGRAPRYLQKVGAVFKTCGLFPITREAFKYGTFKEKIASGLGQGKFLWKDYGGHIKACMQRVLGQRTAPVFTIPLGCYAYSDIDFVPFDLRTNDLFFAGSVQHGKKINIPRPKEMARRRMLMALDNLNYMYPQIRIARRVTSGFSESINSQPDVYLQTMMNTKFCPIPRGANLETFRFYEAIRYGSIPIAEALPDLDHYKNSPVIRLKDWKELSSVVMSFHLDPEKSKDMHNKCLEHWKNVCSETAVAKHIADKISYLDLSAIDNA
ncbi:MAG: hypothetical protein IPH06_13935 [Alphaproteobacteria bacterium]|nr:hypothetical protein [Alphaproteobacteria bacterium]